MHPLHDVEALEAIAEGHGLAADWARSRLVFSEPTRPVPLPGPSVPFTPWLVTRPDALAEVLNALDDTRDVATVAVLEALELGLLPEDTTQIERRLREAIRGDGDPEDLHLAAGLARMGPVPVEVVAAASRSSSPDRDWLLPSIVVRGIDAAEQPATLVDEIAASLLAAERRRPGSLALCLAELGIPSRSSWDEPAASVRDAASVLGLPSPELPRARGSKKRHAQQVVRHLLGERPDAPSRLLTALASMDAELARRLVYSAAWTRFYAPTDPVADAVYRHAGLDARSLSAARRAVAEEHAPVLQGALDHGLEKAAVLAHHLPGHPLANEVIDFLVRHDVAHRVDLFLGVRAAWERPACVPELLDREETLGLGLLLAEWMPTLDVLEALLSLSLPEGPEWTRAYARSLAAMGDPAAADVLRALIRDEPEATEGARHLAESILHQPLA